MTVAVAVKDGKAVAYLCDGKKIEAWLEGTLTGDELALTGPGGASLDGTVDEGGAVGTVAAGGKSWPYSAKAVQAPEGLYAGRSDVRGVTNRIGWIVVDGTGHGAAPAGRRRRARAAAGPGEPRRRSIVDGAPFPVTALTGAADVVRGAVTRPVPSRSPGGSAWCRPNPRGPGSCSSARSGRWSAVGARGLRPRARADVLRLNVAGFSSGVAAKAWLATRRVRARPRAAGLGAGDVRPAPGDHRAVAGRARCTAGRGASRCC